MTARGLKAELRHETRQRTPQLQLSTRSSDRLRCHPDENQSRVASVRKPSPAYIRYGQSQISIRPNVPRSRMRPMRQCCLHKRFRHEAKGARIDRAFGKYRFRSGRNYLELSRTSELKGLCAATTRSNRTFSTRLLTQRCSDRLMPALCRRVAKS
jgi:hypothetical protein